MVHEVNVGSKRGGLKTLQIYGKDYYKKIGKKGGDSVKSRRWFHELSRKSKDRKATESPSVR